MAGCLTLLCLLVIPVIKITKFRRKNELICTGLGQVGHAATKWDKINVETFLSLVVA